MRKSLVAVATLALLTFTAVPVLAHDSGCTPGFWKNHTSEAVWGPTGYTPDTPVTSVFANVPSPFDGTIYDLELFGNAPPTFLEALNYGGGGGFDGAVRILLRAAVAALLNAAHPNVDGFDQSVVIRDTVLSSQGVVGLGGGDLRANMLYFASLFDQENNRGCSIDAHGLPISDSN